MNATRNSDKTVRDTLARQRKIQREVDRQDATSKPKKAQAPLQAGLHTQPELPMPDQHLEKPGIESQLNLQPRFLAPDYKGSAKLEGMVALITGADSGIGRAVAILFAREGADVAIVYLCEHDDARITKEHVEGEGRRCLLIPGDVKDSKFCAAAVKKTVKEFGRLDILVNNAAFQDHTNSLEALSEEHFDETIKTNLYGYYHMAKCALPHLRPGSSIICTGSETGLYGHPTLLDYSATKGAIHAFSKALATNVVDRGIRVNVVAPGPVWTPLNPADQAPEKIRRFGQGTDMKRPAQPEEISPAYVFLAAPACSAYITGVVLPVMGGVVGSAG